MTKPTEDSLYANDFAIITPEGRIRQTSNTYFEAKEVGSVDPASLENLEEAIQPYTSIFDALVEERDELLKSVSEAENASELVSLFVEKARNSAAIGDFDALLSPLSGYQQIEASADSQAIEKETSEASDEEEEVPTLELEEEDEDEEVVLEEETDTQPADPLSDDTPVEDEEETEVEAEAETAAEPVFVPQSAQFAEGDPHYPFEQFVLKAEEIAVSNDWQYGNLEFDNIRFKWDELPPVSDDAQKELVARLQKAQTLFNERRSAHFEKMTQVRAGNLQKKKDLLEKLSGIVRDGRWNAINELKSLERRWENIRQIPADEVERLQLQFDNLRKTFEEKRIDFLVKRKEREEENLNVKRLILDKLKMINAGINEETKNWENLDSLFEGLSQQWRKVGPVTAEKEDEIWDQYKSALETYHQNKLTFNKAYKAELERNLKKKTNIATQAEALVEDPDLVNAARQINRLHREWKETGPIPREQSDLLWERFKKASDAFNERKNQNLDVIRDAENANYDAKEKLCEQAEALLESNDFSKGSREMQALSAQWKEIGPVPRRKSKAIWNRFKKAMDSFFQKRRDVLKDARREEKDNYKAKKDIIEQINKLIELEDPQQAVNEIKPLQEAYQKIGFVPMKYKNKLWAKYKEACDAVYQRARENRAARSVQKADNRHRSYAEATMSPDRKRANDFQRMKKECDELQQLILHYSDTKTFIKPSKQGNKLRDDIQAKIDAAQAKLYTKLDEMDQIRRDMEAAKEQQ